MGHMDAFLQREDVNNEVIENIEIDSGGGDRDDDLLMSLNVDVGGAKKTIENDGELILENRNVSPIVNDSVIALSKEEENTMERDVSKEKVNEGEVPVCDISKQFPPFVNSFFWVNNEYCARSKCSFSLGDENGLVRNKEPPDKGFCSDQESSMKWENLSNNMEGIKEPLVDQEVANFINSSPRQTPREPKMESSKIRGFASSVGLSSFVVKSLAEKNL
ncbi:unnamed protein product [Ilex paraguariensis]|uniref:Uncharacterized protein n=1 Tax=Ilex paraguariensis TaxID=185542 RepID=A0ABC8SFB0_9AQUA